MFDWDHSIEIADFDRSGDSIDKSIDKSIRQMSSNKVHNLLVQSPESTPVDLPAASRWSSKSTVLSQHDLIDQAKSFDILSHPLTLSTLVSWPFSTFVLHLCVGAKLRPSFLDYLRPNVDQISNLKLPATSDCFNRRGGSDLEFKISNCLRRPSKCFRETRCSKEVLERLGVNS